MSGVVLSIAHLNDEEIFAMVSELDKIVKLYDCRLDLVCSSQSDADRLYAIVSDSLTIEKKIEILSKQECTEDKTAIERRKAS